MLKKSYILKTEINFKLLKAASVEIANKKTYLAILIIVEI